MKKLFPCSITLAAVLCTSLLFSCTSNIEMPPPPEPIASSSSTGNVWDYSSSTGGISSSSGIGSSSSSIGGISSSGGIDGSSSSTGGSSSSGGIDGSSSSGGVVVNSSNSSGCTAANNTSAQYCSNGTMKQYGSVTDNGGRTYKTVVIGTQTWMAENLNYNAANSRCYGDNSGGDSQGNCAKYGRLYNWATAMNIAASCNNISVASCGATVSSKHQGICPPNWHLPSDTDWNVLMKFVSPGCTDNNTCAGAGTKLKAASGWGGGNDTNDYDFSALPGGYGYSGGYFGNGGSIGYWWSARESSANYAFYRRMSYYYEPVYRDYGDKSDLYSVRCVQD